MKSSVQPWADREKPFSSTFPPPTIHHQEKQNTIPRSIFCTEHLATTAIGLLAVRAVPLAFTFFPPARYTQSSCDCLVGNDVADGETGVDTTSNNGTALRDS